MYKNKSIYFDFNISVGQNYHCPGEDFLTQTAPKIPRGVLSGPEVWHSRGDERTDGDQNLLQNQS